MGNNKKPNYFFNSNLSYEDLIYASLQFGVENELKGSLLSKLN